MLIKPESETNVELMLIKPESETNVELMLIKPTKTNIVIDLDYFFKNCPLLY